MVVEVTCRWRWVGLEKDDRRTVEKEGVVVGKDTDGGWRCRSNGRGRWLFRCVKEEERWRVLSWGWTHRVDSAGQGMSPSGYMSVNWLHLGWLGSWYGKIKHEGGRYCGREYKGERKWVLIVETESGWARRGILRYKAATLLNLTMICISCKGSKILWPVIL